MRRAVGAVAQLGERVVRNDEVRGSIPLGSTSLMTIWTTTGREQQGYRRRLHVVPSLMRALPLACVQLISMAKSRNYFDKACQVMVWNLDEGECPMATMNVSLPDAMKGWVEARLKDGKFSNVSEYVRHLIRRDHGRKEAIDALQQAIDKGINSGDPEPFDFKAFKARMRERHVRQ